MLSPPALELAVPGVTAGHWTDATARTGCTVVLLPEGTVASGEVRGGAPATREFDLLRPGRLVERVDAVLLTGGSAFGLAAADGVVRWCEAQVRGFPTVAGPVPIVVAMGLYDLAVGDASVRPGPAEGEAACRGASASVPLGPVGAGCGATVGKWRGRDHARPGGLGGAVVRDGELVVSALVAVNAWGEPDRGHEPDWPEVAPTPDPEVFGNTTIGVVVTNAAVDKAGCRWLAEGGHDGLARALVPSHARVDGDALVAAATGALPLDALPGGLERVRLAATRAVERAVRSLAVPEPAP